MKKSPQKPRTTKKARKTAANPPAVSPAPRGKWIKATAVRVRKQGRRLVLDLKK